MALALNNLQRVDMPLNKETNQPTTKANMPLNKETTAYFFFFCFLPYTLILFSPFSFFYSLFAQSAGAVEYDCISAEG